MPIEKSRLSPKPLPPGIFRASSSPTQRRSCTATRASSSKKTSYSVTESLVHSGFASIDRMGTVFEVETALGYTVSNRNSRHKTPGATSSSTSPSTPSSGGLSCLNTNSATRSRSACSTPVGSNILSWIGALSADTSVVSTCLFAVALPISFSPARRIARRAAHSFVRQVARAPSERRRAANRPDDRAPQHAWCHSRVLLRSFQAHRRSARPLHLRHLA